MQSKKLLAMFNRSSKYQEEELKMSIIQDWLSSERDFEAILRDNNLSLGTKAKLMRPLVISIFPYALEPWTLSASLR